MYYPQVQYLHDWHNCLCETHIARWINVYQVDIIYESFEKISKNMQELTWV